MVILGLILAMLLTYQSYDFDAIAHAGAPLGVERLENFMEMSMDKFEIFLERSGETTRLHK